MYSATEGATQGAIVTVQLSDPAPQRLVIPITARGMSGATTDDWSGVPSALIFSTGDVEQSFEVVAVDDTVEDDGEMVALGFGTLPAGVIEGRQVTATVTLMNTENGDHSGTTEQESPDGGSSRDDGGSKDDGADSSSGGTSSTRRACPPLIPPLLPLIGQTDAATAYALPGERVLLHIHASASASVVLALGHSSPDGSTLVPGGFVRDQERGHTYTVIRRAADGLIVRRWIAPDDPLIYAVPWDQVTTQYTFPVAVLAAIPLDELHPPANQLARRFDGTDNRVLVYAADLGRWWHVPNLAILQALGFAPDDITAADTNFIARVALARSAPFPRIIGQTVTATAYEVPGDRVVLQRHDDPADPVVVGVGWIAADGMAMVPVGFVRDDELGQPYAVVRREADDLIVRRWMAPDDPLLAAVPWEQHATVPISVLTTIPLDEQHPRPNMLARRFEGPDQRLFAYDAGRQRWWHVPDPATFQAWGFSPHHVTAADAAFFTRIATGASVPQPILPAPLATIRADQEGCPPPPPPLPRIIGQNHAATAYELPGKRLLLHHHGSAVDSVVIGIGWIAPDGTSIVPVGFVRDAERGHTYALIQRAVDGLIVRRWIAPNDPLVYAIPWDIVNSQYTLPGSVLTTVPLDERYPRPNQLARRLDGDDDRIFAYDAALERWWHVPHPAVFQALGFAWNDVTAADAGFAARIAPDLASPLPRVIRQNSVAAVFELPGDRVVLFRHDHPTSAVAVAVGRVAADGTLIRPGGLVRDAERGLLYTIVRRASDGVIVRRWIAPNDPLVAAIPWDIVNSQYTLPGSVLTTVPLDERHLPSSQLSRRPDRTDGRVLALAADRLQ